MPLPHLQFFQPVHGAYRVGRALVKLWRQVLLELETVAQKKPRRSGVFV
jgi:hypothetical protein